MSALASRRVGLRVPRFGRLPAHAVAFVLLLGAGGGLVLFETRGLSFFGDDWDFVVARPGMGAATLLTPHGPHLSLIPILIYKVLLNVGGGSYLPFRLLAAFDMVVLAGALGWFTRRAWGPWWGLIPVAVLVTLGAAGDSLLWSFQCGYAIATAVGALALVAVQRRTRNADLLACAALVLALASASQGIGFLVGAALLLLLTGDWRRRSWVVLIPGVLYALWYVKYGHQHSETDLSVWNSALEYEFQSLSATLPALVGLGGVVPGTGVLDTSVGIPLAAILLLLLGYRLWRGWRPSAMFWALALTAVTLWLAAALSNTPTIPRPAATARYLGTNAFLVMVCFAAVLPRPSLKSRPVIAGVVVALIVITATNADQFRFARGNMWASDTASRAALGALSLMRGIVPPGFAPATAVEPTVLVGVNVQNFFSAYDSFAGLPIDTPAQLRVQDEPTRELVDAELVRGEVTLTPVTGTGPRATGCQSMGPGVSVLAPPYGTYVLRASTAPVTASMGRFGSAESVAVGTVPVGGTALLAVRRDADPAVPWRLNVTGAGATICRSAG